jgi:hypothetical protein
VEPELYRFLFAITAAAAEELAQASQVDSGVRLIREFRETHGDPENCASDGLLRFGLLHLEGAELKALHAWEGRNASSDIVHRCATTLRILDGESVTDDDLKSLRLSADDDWLWHYPLGYAAWNASESEKAWGHFHRYYVLSEKDGHKGGLLQRMAWAFLTWYRDCQACGRAAAEFHHRRAQILALCSKCKELASDNEVSRLVRDPGVDKSDPRLRALSTFTQLFDYCGERRQSHCRVEQWKRSKSRLKYHRLPTLTRFLDEECRQVYEQARATARDHGLDEPDSVCLLIHVLRAMATAEYDSYEELHLQAPESIGGDEPGALRDALNIARWFSILGFSKSSKIELSCLFRGLSFAEKGSAATLMDNHGVSGLYVPTDATEAQRDDVQRLRERLGLRFLVALDHALAGYEGQLWLIENDPKVGFVGSRGKRPEQRAVWLLAYRDALQDDCGEVVFTNAWINIGTRHGDLDRKLYEFGYRALGSTVFLSVLYVQPANKKRFMARKNLETCKEKLRDSSSSGERLLILDTCRSLAEAAGLATEWERYILLSLDNPVTDGYQDWDWYRRKARRDLIRAAFAQKNYDLALQRLLECAADCPLDCERDLIRLAQELWRAGHRIQFHEVLDTLRRRPNPDLALIDETQAAYRVVDSIWTVEEVKKLQPKFLDPL